MAMIMCSLVLASQLSVTQPNRTNKSNLAEFDEFAPETWEKAIDATRERQSELIRKLMEIAKDVDRKDKDRDRAILLLGKMKDTRCIDFLVANVQLTLQPISGAILSDARERPCYYVLILPANRGDWNIAKAILKSLEADKSKDELMYLASVYKSILGTNAAVALLDVELGTRPPPEKKKRLEEFKASIRE